MLHSVSCFYLSICYHIREVRSNIMVEIADFMNESNMLEGDRIMYNVFRKVAGCDSTGIWEKGGFSYAVRI